MSVDLNITASITGAYGATRDLANVVQNLKVNTSYALATGTTTGKADLVFTDTRTLTASSTENLDLAGGLTDVFGATLTFVEVVAIYVKAAAGNANNVVVGGAASNGFAAPFGDATDTVKVAPGGVCLLTNDAGFAVTAGTGDILKIANGGSGTSVTYDIVIVGRSA